LHTMGVVDDVFPILGVALANVLFFAPLPGVAAVARAGMLGSFNVLPQAVMVLSTTVWVMYGLSVANPFIFAANAPGCIASVGYYIVTLPLIPQSASDTRRSMQTIVVAGAAFTVGLWGVLVFSGCPPATRSFYLGLYGSILCVAMFASPLSTVALVVATSDSSSIYAPLALAQVLNCGTWTAYGFAIGDIWVWGPNGCGLGLGLLLVMLKLSYPDRPTGGIGASRGHGGALDEGKALVYSSHSLGKASCSDNDDV